MQENYLTDDPIMRAWNKTQDRKPKLDFSRTTARNLFQNQAAPWHALKGLERQIPLIGIELPYDKYDEIMENVWVHITSYISPTAKISSPAIIGGGAKIGHFSHIKSSIVGSFATIGDSVTVVNSILFDKTKLLGHNSVYSSIIGYESALGQGVMIPNAHLDGTNITVNTLANSYDLGKTKLGSVVCDGVNIGAGSVVSPGSIIDCCSSIPPLTSVSGYIRPYTNAK